MQGARRARKRPTDGDKIIRQFKIAQTEKLAAKARATERAAERLAVVDKPWEGWRLELTFAEAPRAGAVVARLEGAVVERGPFRLGPVDVEIGWGERLALAGPNGCGKTTLLGALLGRVPLAAGRRWVGPGVVVGELDQARRVFSDPRRTLLEAFTDTTDLHLGEARTLLAKFGLGADQVGRVTTSLSPGERTRASLAAFQATGTNTAVLDEPTNHLDLPAIEQLEEALGNFAGTLVVVSHDRAFLDALALTRTITLGRPDGPGTGARDRRRSAGGLTGHAMTGHTMAGLAELLRGRDPALADLPGAGTALALGEDSIGALRALADARPGWRGYGLVARHQPAPRGGHPAVRGDVAALPFRSGEFDAVLADHVPDRLSGAGRVAQELARVCRPSGRIVVVLDGRGHQAELLRRRGRDRRHRLVRAHRPVHVRGRGRGRLGARHRDRDQRAAP